MQFQWADLLAALEKELAKTLYKLSQEDSDREFYRLQGEARRLRWAIKLPELLKEEAQEKRKSNI